MKYEKINYPNLKNPTFAFLWSYDGALKTFGRPQTARRRVILKSTLVKIFTKTTNFNKPYLASSDKVFLSPGILLRSYSDINAKSLKKKPKVWGLMVRALKRVSTKPLILELGDLYGRKEFLVKRILQQRIKVAWFFFRINYRSAYQNKPKRRIKRWVKKKYFRLGSKSV